MALFEALWKPMYVYDLLCGTFCLLSLLAYAHRRWILSLAAFWLAYKSKEVAVMLPVALAFYEYWFGKRNWLRIAPFALVSLSFGIQGLLFNPNANQNNNYTFHFTPSALAKTSSFYAARVFLVPYLGFAFPLVAPFARSGPSARRTWFGLAAMGVFFLPLLFLPGRLHSAYCYVPFTGLAIAFSGIAEAMHPAAVAAVLVLFIPLDFHQLRVDRRAPLAMADEVREWVGTLRSFAKPAPRLDAVLYSGIPAGLDAGGLEGALQYLFPRSEFPIADLEDASAARLRQLDRVAVLNWDGIHHKLSIVARTPETADAAYFEVGPAMPVWQLGEGWYSREGAYCWIAPDAVARLAWPERARSFGMRVNVGPELIRSTGAVTVRISIDGHELSPKSFDKAGWQEARWDVTEARTGTASVTFHVEPGYRQAGSRPLGIAIGGFGFLL